MIYAFVKKGSFQDSVSLMLISRKLSASPGVDEVSVMMGTPANKALLEATGFWHSDFTTATPNDICAAIRTHEQMPEIIDIIRTSLENELNTIAQGQSGGQHLQKARRWESSQQKLPDANLLLISIAGEYAAELAQQGLDDGKNVMLFSDNVSLEQEIALKQSARAKGLLVMGPDCGTAMVAGAPLAFANVLPKGSIGVIGASGTGIQELTSQIALLRQGVTHALGLGGRDLSAEVGGISALSALEMLAADSQSKVLAFVSKPPAESVRLKVLAAMKSIAKPVVALFLGAKPEKRHDGNVWLASSLAEAAQLAVMLANVEEIATNQPDVTERKILGLYAGGTLAAEAAMLLADQIGAETDKHHHQGIMLNAQGHKLIDLGDDVYTVGRPHPMIDPTTRSLEIQKLANQPETGVLLLDVVLGYGACDDPALAVVEAVNQIRTARGNKHPLVVIATVTGTQQDPQPRAEQIDALINGDIVVMNTLQEAVLLAHHLTTRHPSHQPITEPPLLQGVKVINAGLRSFAQDLQTAGCPVVHYQWAPAAGGNQHLAALLKKLN
ncbi:acyl-CoA synthetase FdrA [Budviciaceae bacterium BWR-B9]|uniref:Acyl-CoA synthetase FdrA n=1 Tax=Limnobaculum allomyrinae TaxID=2791986 RepID=A0ABS1ILW8_9GAMM|nr:MULTISPECIES: acyl-CoA synthetase FdrA [Limnobaculum]MBK5142684.1 acyl-CoA synthetase FdrA [Limnobaculum allomyrinae]MBV7690430.1 acyl-CoA synthetase FdrA [Limnobaculum sp. M2-1]